MKTKTGKIKKLTNQKQNGTEQFDEFIYSLIVENFLLSGTESAVIKNNKKIKKNINKIKGEKS